MPEWLVKSCKRLYKPRPLKSTTKQTEWLEQAEQNVEKWKRQQAWLNQFAKTIRKQNKQLQTKQSSNPWKKSLPSTFYWIPEIAQAYKETEGWKEVNSIANHEFQACFNGQKYEEGKPPLGS